MYRKFMGLVLALALLLPLLPYTAPVVNAAAEPLSYDQELSERKIEYAKKFNMSDLTWSGATTANGNIDYGGSSRNYLYWQAGSFGGVAYKNYIHVYAFEGDTIYFGSNIYNSTLNLAGTGTISASEKTALEAQLGAGATIDIVLEDLRGNRIAYDVKKGGAGHISNVQTEVLAKTMEDPTNCSGTVGSTKYTYTPLSYKVQETGVYTFEFHSYDMGGTTGQTTKNDADFYNGTAARDENAQGALVAAWDISVFNEQGQKVPGRVYADYLSFQQNGGKTIETYYVVTTDNYIYRWDWNGVTPNTYNFFADNRGLTDNATGSTLYKSVKEVQNSRFDYTQFGASYKYPGSANTDQAKSFYIFFEKPNPDLQGHLYSRAILPDPAENIRFMNTVIDPATNEPVVGAYMGQGGYFSFDTKEATTATLVLDFSRIGGGTKYAPVTISGPVKPYSSNYFYWDGKDGDGVVIPAGTYNIADMVTVTTKAGEIHFPVHDVETSVGGFTFTRISPIFDREGNQISDIPGHENILDAVKSVIYYDDSAIYYGEHVGQSGLPESEVNFFKNNSPAKKTTDDMGNTYYLYANMESNGGEYAARQTAYIKNNVTAAKAGKADYVRIGDHSHVSNKIEYYSGNSIITDWSLYKDAIDYLDSAKHPVGIARTSERNTYDFGISDFWTFIPAQPAVTTGYDESLKIVSGDSFTLTGQVFYDNDNSGDYDMMADSDSLLSGVTLNLYKQTLDTVPDPNKTYFFAETVSTKTNPQDKVDASHLSVSVFSGESFSSGTVYFELISTGVTPVEGRFFFPNLTYDKSSGTMYMYEVMRPDSSYYLTSGTTKPVPLGAAAPKNGSYSLYAYDSSSSTGSEVQILKIGGSGGVDPTKNLMGVSNNTVTAVDVGYHFNIYTKLTLKKLWSAKDISNVPQPTVFEVRYLDSNHQSHIYDEHALAQITNLEYSYELLPATMDGKPVTDWYVSAEYYIYDGKLFKHTFDYDVLTGSYTSFLGDTWYIDGISGLEDLTDTNSDGMKDQFDLPGLTGWVNVDDEGVFSAPFNAVLDFDPGTAEIKLSITNTVDPGTVEVLKYTGAIEDKNYLAGATFRIYTAKEGEPELTLDTVQKYIETENAANIQWLAEHQVGSATTRPNGRVAFAGLDPSKHYVVREMFAPAGYRMMDALYIIHPLGCEHDIEHPGDMSDELLEQFSRQNFRFNSDDYVQVSIANIPADGDMTIRKRIDGRAWNTNDSFTFDISLRDTSGTPLNSASLSSVDSIPGFFTLDDSETSIYASASAKSQLLSKLKEFVAAFNRAGVSSDITVNYASEFAPSVSSGTPLSDTKQSVPLITVFAPDAKDEHGTPVEPFNALLNHDNFDGLTGIEFPAAGEYILTVHENASESDLLSSSRVFTLYIHVSRVSKPGFESAGELTLSNSYLSAEVTNIFYQDASSPEITSASFPVGYGSRRVFADIAPTFVNTYEIKPAVQVTSYAITKTYDGHRGPDGQLLNISGSVTNGWLENEHFLISISGADSITSDALRSSQIYIGGLYGAMDDDGLFPEKKVLSFNRTNVTNENQTLPGHDTGVDAGHTFNFEEIDFHNILFPVQWVFAESAHGYVEGEVVPDVTHVRMNSEGVYVYMDDPEDPKSIETKVVSKTQDIVYTLVIQEEMPEGASEENGYKEKGIVYDPKMYTMVIILRNAVNADPNDPSAGVNDGLIDELDFMLYDCGPEHINDPGRKPVATCETDQRVASSFDDWAGAQFDDSAYTERSGYTWQPKWYYINSDQIIREAEVVERDASNKPSKFSVKVESSIHPSGTIYIVPGDEEHVPGSDTYSFKAALDAGLTFAVKREGHTGSHTMTFSNKYEPTASWTPTVTKTLNGRDWNANESFEFRLEATDWPGKGTRTPQAPVLKNGTSASMSIQPDSITGSNGVTYTGELPAVSFTCPGVYAFSIHETNPYGGGTDLLYGDMQFTVTVTDNLDGTMSMFVSVSADGKELSDSDFFSNTNGTSVINFVNTYDESGSFDLAISKTLTGKDWSTRDRFAFTIQPDTTALEDISNGVLSVPSEWGRPDSSGAYTVYVDGSLSGADAATRLLSLGTLQVGNLHTLGASYRFTVTEKTDGLSANSFFCPQPSLTLDLTVSSEMGNEDQGYTGNLEFVATYAYLSTGTPVGSEDPVSELILPFTNYFFATGEPDETYSELSVRKVLEGRAWEEYDSFNVVVRVLSTDIDPDSTQYAISSNADEAFEFLAADTVMRHAFTFSDHTDWTVYFRFFKEGQYVFEVSETPGDVDGVTYDVSKFTVTFDVSRDSAQDNQLIVSRTISRSYPDTAAVSEVVFLNLYGILSTLPETGGVGVIPVYALGSFLVCLGIGVGKKRRKS